MVTCTYLIFEVEGKTVCENSEPLMFPNIAMYVYVRIYRYKLFEWIVINDIATQCM